MHTIARLAVATSCLLVAAPALAQDTFLTFESGHVRPVALSPDGTQLFAVNTPDSRLEIFDIDGAGFLTQSGVVQVGMEPVAVAARSNDEVWVVNFLSDSVSVVDLSGSSARVVRTLLVGDEPSDIVFAGPAGNRAFITAAHRGQNSPYPQGEYDVEGIGRADIWVFDATGLGTSLGGDPETIITVFGDKPRALAVSGDGSAVYAAIFRSGNQTTTLNEAFTCDTSLANMASNTVQGPCSIAGTTSPGGYPPPHRNHEGFDRPEVGLIVKYNRDGGSANHWTDELGRNWDDFVNFDLPDRDVFEIDANANPPVAVNGSSACSDGAGCWAHVGTTLFNMAVNPVTGKIYVSNTDAQNHIRFEGPGTLAAPIKPGGEPPTVQGNLAQSRITVLDGSTVTPIHLNKHIDYSILPAPTGVKEKSLATPLDMAVSSDGNTLYVAALGSSKVGIFDTAQLENDTFTPSASSHVQLSGGGPTGLALSGNRLYVMTRFDNSISVVDTTAKLEIQTVPLHNPEPVSVVEGRPFLYDAVETSSNGEASCSSCHVFGDMDDLAWDLGNPDDDQKPNTNDFADVPLDHCGLLPCVFHPIKGPMTTQSLRGLDLMGPQHWRGDREGDAVFSFNAFNVAFPNLVGREGELTTTQMQAFTDFALQIRYPPNPSRQLDNSRRTQEDSGFDMYHEPATDIVASCNDCHTLDAAQGFFGTAGLSTFDAEPQHFKVPHLRNVYQKLGMFGEPEPDPASIPGVGSARPFDGPYTHTGDQIRGYGYTHDGSVDTLFRFLSAGVFQLNNNEQRQLEAFMISMPTDLAPIVGQQVTLTSTSPASVGDRIGLMIQRASTNFFSKVLTDLNGGPVTECDLIAKLNEGGRERGYLREAGGLFKPDDNGSPIDDAALRAKAAVAGQEVTYTCAPPGSGYRMGIDRDDDLLLDGVETDSGIYVNPSNTGTDPALADTDHDGWDDGVEVQYGTNPNDENSFPMPPLPGLSGWGMALVVGALLVTGGRLGRRQRGRSQ